MKQIDRLKLHNSNLQSIFLYHLGATGPGIILDGRLGGGMKTY
jgi:hypothetical protein